MSVINDKLQFQLLLLLGTFHNAYGNDVTADYVAAYNAAYGAAYRATSSFTFDAAHDITSYITFNAAKKVLGNKNINVGLFASFKELFKLDKKIQEEIKSQAMTKIPDDHKSPKDEKELVESLLVVNITEISAPIQTYWIAVSVVYGTV